MNNLTIKQNSIIKTCITIGVVIVIIFLLMLPIINYLNPQTIEGKVVDKYQKRSDKTDYFYLVIEDKNNQKYVIQNSDLLFKKKFNSADIQANLDKNKNYKIKTTGYRIQILDNYPILNKIKEVK